MGLEQEIRIPNCVRSLDNLKLNHCPNAEGLILGNRKFLKSNAVGGEHLLKVSFWGTGKILFGNSTTLSSFQVPAELVKVQSSAAGTGNIYHEMK
jgi:hypothetical protein